MIERRWIVLASALLLPTVGLGLLVLRAEHEITPQGPLHVKGKREPIDAWLLSGTISSAR
ncbi:MAG: hypothetical protein WKH68_05755 [Candidatus Limnocylindria bacterium]